ncbi:MAG: DUF5916 domain-containing protein [Gemmatimonadaceae bacterium]
MPRPAPAVLARLALVALAAAAVPSAPAQVVMAAAGDAGVPTARAGATRAVAARVAQPPTLDGRADDAAWTAAQVIDQFLEYEPNEGRETRFKTEVRVTYDDRNLYVLARMYDPAPDSIVSLLSRRDVRTPSEQLKLVIDSYHDRRTAYQFIVNPAGVKRDFYVYNDSNEDPSWDAVWDVATAIDSLGWVAEFRIPFSQLRFANKTEHTFGFMVVRDVARTNQRISWPLYHRTVQGYVSQAGEIGGLVNIPTPRRLEVVPYAVASNASERQTLSARGSDLTLYSRAAETSMGADVKYVLSSTLTLDATINPDFGQVEADPAVLNLSAFETFFQERRPFFLEGTGIFDFRVSCQDIDSGCTGLFYSRRIGRAPQLSDWYGTEASPTATTIAGAAKLTGRVRGMSVGLLDAVTERERGLEGATIEPQTNYLVARARQELDAGTDVGVMFTSVNRSLDDFSADLLRREAYAGGVDFRHRFLRNNYELAAMVSGSLLRGSEAAIARAQTDGVHRYQRPDDDVAYDPTRTGLAGDAQRITVSKFGGGRTRFQALYERYSAGYDINDAGFLSRADVQTNHNWLAFQFQKPARFYQRAFWNFNTHGMWTTAGLPLSVGLNTNAHVQFKNFLWGHYGINYNDFVPTYSDRAARGGPAVRKSKSVNMWGGLEGDSRKRVIPYLWTNFSRGDGGRSTYWGVDPNVELRISSQFSLSLGAGYSRNTDDWQWFDNYGDITSDTTHYTFAHLDQTTTNLSTRINWTATPNLSLQFYAQPFVTTGGYGNWREIGDARAARYEDRFRPYLTDADGDPTTAPVQGDPGGFRYSQLRSNTVVRWEYRPGSALFLVWQQGRELYDPRAYDFEFRRDARHLFGLHPDNTLLVKASWWLNL